jgi:hypothetical protein
MDAIERNAVKLQWFLGWVLLRRKKIVHVLESMIRACKTLFQEKRGSQQGRKENKGREREK